ncbi:MAG: hypothetical protein WD208_13560 [Dehalococcoidia bacterium]
MFDDKSRYSGLDSYEVTDNRGRRVTVVPAPPVSKEIELGVHLRMQGQRLDHLAHRYLNNPSGFWRICDLNGTMLPEALSEAREIRIPRKQRGG